MNSDLTPYQEFQMKRYGNILETGNSYDQADETSDSETERDRQMEARAELDLIEHAYL